MGSVGLQMLVSRIPSVKIFVNDCMPVLRIRILTVAVIGLAKLDGVSKLY